MGFPSVEQCSNTFYSNCYDIVYGRPFVPPPSSGLLCPCVTNKFSGMPTRKLEMCLESTLHIPWLVWLIYMQTCVDKVASCMTSISL